MSNEHDIDNERRTWLIQALAAGVFQGTSSLLDAKPSKLGPGRSIFSITGDVQVNDKTATLQTPIRAGDTVQTAKNSEVIFVVDTHAMILRGNSKLLIELPNPTIGALIIGGLRLATGKLLSVSRNSPMRVTTANAIIGIRGTGFYVESEPKLSYFCTCYGAAEVQAIEDPQSKELIASVYHDRPVYILKDGGIGKNIRNAPFLNHTDQELSLIEALVGRKPPFSYSKNNYSHPPSNY
jgi:hypothetical protein